MNLDTFISTATTELGSSTLASAFHTVAGRYPEQVAVVCGRGSLTYQELDQRSTRMAAWLRLGDQYGIVAIVLERSVDLAVAMLAVLKAGKAYLPIDAGYPAVRVLAMLEDAQPEVIVTEQHLVALTAGAGIPTVCVEDLPNMIDADIPQDRVNAASVAYVLYTSGSTGKPKAVQVTHRNVLRLLTSTDPWFRFGPDDVWTMFHSFAFDFSVWEMWGPLLTGGRLVIVPFAVSRSPQEFYALLREQRVTVLNQTPSAFQLLMQVEAGLPDAALAEDLRFVIFGGEALRFRALRPWFARHRETKPQLVNMYGITETTVHVTHRPVTTADAEMETESLIGQPIPDLRLYLLDERGADVADGEPGEMYIGGAGVALGYLKRPELNAERFLDDTRAGPGERMYRSGDLARRRADGEMVYLGRDDGQVKVNGFRIELGEVEAVLMSVPGITQVCVRLVAASEAGARLSAYFVASKDGMNTHAVAEQLRGLLPAHMVPVFYTQLAKMPLTGNGKIDYEALPAAAIGSGTRAVSLTSGTEEMVASAWGRVLKSEHVGAEDNFFEIGGSSLLLIALRSELEKQLQRSIPVTWLFEHTTVRAMAARLTADPDNPSIEDKDAAKEKANRQRAAFARARTAKQVGTERGSWRN